MDTPRRADQTDNAKGVESTWRENLSAGIAQADELRRQRLQAGPGAETITVPRRGRSARLAARLVRDERGSVGYVSTEIEDLIAAWERRAADLEADGLHFTAAHLRLCAYELRATERDS